MPVDERDLRVLGSAVLSLGTDAIFIVDAATLRLTQANRAFTRALGYAPEEVPGLTIYDLSSADRTAIAERLARLEAEGELMLGVRSFRHRDGRLVPMEARVGTTVVSGRKLYCVVARDLTTMREAERSLRESEERFRQLAEVAFEGIFITDRGRIVDVNRRGSEMLGAPPEELVGRAVTDFVAPQSREKVAGHLATGSEVPYEHVALRADGAEFPVEVQAKSLTVGGRRLRVTALRDVSQRRSLEAQLQQAQRLESVGRLAGGIAHDFNNLLTVILSMTKVLGRAPHNEENAADLAQIAFAAEQASTLTRQLLAFARRQVLQPAVLDVNALVLDLEGFLRRVLKDGIALEARYGEDVGHVRADPGQVEQVLMNLAINARDAMEGGGTLTIETGRLTVSDPAETPAPELAPGEYVTISVRDTGCGMDEGTLRRAFEPFFTTKGHGQGTGLGLSVCYGIVKQAGGSIRAESVPGEGTVFRVCLPRVAGAPRLPEEPPSEMPQRGDETLLVVDDDAMVRRLVLRVLRSHGYRTIEAADAGQALRAFEEHGATIDLVVTDLVLPDLSGRELAARLRSGRPELEVLFTSGYSNDVAMQRGIAEGTVHFLAKPYVPRELLRRVREALDDREVQPSPVSLRDEPR